MAEGVLRWCLDQREQPLPWPAPGGQRAGRSISVALGFTWAVDELVRGGLVDDADEARLLSFLEQVGAPAASLDRGGALGRLSRAAARREVLRGLPPRWRMSSDGELEREGACAWVARGLRAFRAPAPSGESPARPTALWMRDEEALASSLELPAPVDAHASLGEAELRFERQGLTVVGPFGSWLAPYRSITALELWSDGFGIRTKAERHVLVTEESWLHAELARILLEQSRTAVTSTA